MHSKAKLKRECKSVRRFSGHLPLNWHPKDESCWLEQLWAIGDVVEGVDLHGGDCVASRAAATYMGNHDELTHWHIGVYNTMHEQYVLKQLDTHIMQLTKDSNMHRWYKDDATTELIEKYFPTKASPSSADDASENSSDSGDEQLMCNSFCSAQRVVAF